MFGQLILIKLVPFFFSLYIYSLRKLQWIFVPISEPYFGELFWINISLLLSYNFEELKKCLPHTLPGAWISSYQSSPPVSSAYSGLWVSLTCWQTSRSNVVMTTVLSFRAKYMTLFMFVSVVTCIWNVWKGDLIKFHYILRGNFRVYHNIFIRPTSNLNCFWKAPRK